MQIGQIISAKLNNSRVIYHFQISPIYNPDAANAQANQRLVEEMAEQNRLMRELIQMKGKP